MVVSTGTDRTGLYGHWQDRTLRALAGPNSTGTGRTELYGHWQDRTLRALAGPDSTGTGRTGFSGRKLDYLDDIDTDCLIKLDLRWAFYRLYSGASLPFPIIPTPANQENSFGYPGMQTYRWNCSHSVNVWVNVCKRQQMASYSDVERLELLHVVHLSPPCFLSVCVSVSLPWLLMDTGWPVTEQSWVDNSWTDLPEITSAMVTLGWESAARETQQRVNAI